MALVVNTNLTSMFAIGTLNKTNGNLSNTLARVSSGVRINTAGDDAAGLGVAENLRAAQTSLRRAQRNTNDGLSVINTADTASAEVGNILNRMRELAVQSSSETLHDDERAYIQDEYTELAAEVDRIASVTEFNGQQLADGSLATMDVQVGIHDTANDRIQITLGDLRGATLGVDTASLDLSTAATAQTALTDIDTAIDTVNGYRSGLGATQNRLESTSRNLETYTQSLAAAESQIRDADFAQESADLAKYQVMQQAGVSALAQARNINSQAAQLIG